MSRSIIDEIRVIDCDTHVIELSDLVDFSGAHHQWSELVPDVERSDAGVDIRYRGSTQRDGAHPKIRARVPPMSSWRSESDKESVSKNARTDSP
jgi:hypothetical protein